MSQKPSELLDQLNALNASELRRLLVEHLTKQKLGLYWESNAVERDKVLNANLVFPRLLPELGYSGDGLPAATRNLIIEGDNYDSLRLLQATHRGKIRVIYIDPPYNTGNKDWVYNDHYVGANDRWRHSQWLEFLFRRLTLARDLLTPDGVILVSINDENRARLELLMDEVFPGRRLGTITWRTRQGSNDASSYFLSVDHEHVLVYGNAGFSFNGFGKSYEMYGNPDQDPRGDWMSDNLTCPKDFRERPNLYYPIRDPKTGVSYPPNPDRVWVYASNSRLQADQTVEAKTMEEFIALGQIIFPAEQRVETWPTMEALLEAIDTGDVPRVGKNAVLRRDLPNLEYWVGRPVGFGRPRFKRYKADLRNQTQPLSSWVVPNSEVGNYDAESSFVAGSNQEGARVVAEIFGDRAFNYAKPLSLIKNLLQQATRPGDIVLDFFAGSGTAGHAVLELNAEDGASKGNPRSFILCSSSEATSKEPEKNLCRDVCAERIRRVMQGYGGKVGLGGAFAYLQLDLIEAADLPFEATPEHAGQMLALRLYGSARPVVEVAAGVRFLGLADDCAHLLLPEVNASVLDGLQQWLPDSGAARLAIWSPRPESLRAALASRDIEANCYGLLDALMRGQGNSALGEKRP